MRVTAARPIYTLQEITWDHSLSTSKLDALHAASRRREGVLKNFVERVYAGYSALRIRHTINNHSQFHDLLADEQSIGEYIGGYCKCFGEYGSSLFIDEATSDEEPVDVPSSQIDDEDDIIEVVVSNLNTSSSALKSPFPFLPSSILHYFVYSDLINNW